MRAFADTHKVIGMEPDDEDVRLRNLVSPLDKTVLEAGTVLGKYKIIEEAGRGGMAIVYKAMQLDLNRVVAVKVMPANISLNTKFVERFLSEAHAVAKLNHPNIVNVYEAASEGNTYYIAMEYVEGKSLYQYLNDAKPKLVDVLEIAIRLADALSYAHGQKIIHRDLKLGNVLMKGPLTPLLIDFGLAKALEESDSGGGITRTGEIMGSPAYMAPERLNGREADHRSDICSLGIMLYEMLTFKNPYLDQRNLHQTTFNVMEANPLPPRKLVPWLPVEVEAITLKAMAKDPAKRYDSMDAFRDDIRRYLRGDAVLAKPPSFKNRVVKKIRRRAVPIAISAIVLLFSAILGAGYYLQLQRAYSNWQLVYSQPDRLSSVDWELINIDSTLVGRIEDANRAFTLSSPGMSYVTLDNRFSRDMLIEFDVRAVGRSSLANVGVFILGDAPHNAYAAHINRGGFGASGITFPHGQFLFQDTETGTIPWRETNRVTLERSQSSVTMTINGVQVAKIYDYFRPIGREHEQVGFFVNASEATFGNIRIFRRAIPQVPSPTLIADRFRERGDFESAIEEYTGLMLDQTTLNLALELHINIAECQIRLGRYEEALATIEQSAHLQGNDALRARAKYLSGVAHRFMGDTLSANADFETVITQYASSSVAFTVSAERIENILRTINTGDRGDQVLALTDSGAADFPRMSAHWGALHMKFLTREATLGNVDRALDITSRMTTLYEGVPPLVTRARLALADAYLNAAQTAPAIEIYNQAIRTTTTSENSRRAWYALAETYENDFEYAQAAVIYTRLVREAATSSPTYWMAALKNAEHAARTSGGIDRVEGLLSDIIGGAHPYPLPRIVAQYYLGRITEIEFLSRWDNIYPSNSWSLYYVARKLLLQGNRDEALEVMQVLQRQLPEVSWEMFKVRRILHNSTRWN